MEPRRERDVDPRALVLCLLVVLVFVTRVLAQVDKRAGDDYQFHTLLLPVDFVLLAALILGVRELPAIRREWRKHPAAIGGLALGMSLVPALLAHPSDRGFAAVLRWFAVCAAAVLFARIGATERRMVLAVLLGATAVNAVVAFGQRIVDGPLGLSVLGEVDFPVVRIGAPAVSGMLVHPYVMGAWIVVVVTALAALTLPRPPHWTTGAVGLGVLFVASAPLGMSMARSAALAGIAAGLVLVVAALRSKDRRRALTLVGVVLAGFAVGALVNAGGWAKRAEVTATQSVQGQSIDVTAGRGRLMDQARGLFDEAPVLGVGPGRYVIALSERPDLVALSRQAPRPVHNVPILLVVEGGLVALPGLLILVVGVGWATWKAGLPGLAVLAAYLPFMLLDHLAWSFPQGLVLTGLWLGALDVLSRPGSVGST